jgi:hypothetical protein
VVLAELWKRVTDSSCSQELPAVSIDELCPKLEFLPNFLVVLSSDPASLIGQLNIHADSVSINLIHVREFVDECIAVHRSSAVNKRNAVSAVQKQGSLLQLDAV